MMNLGDPDLELIDPTPNVHTLFIHFDKIFFWTKLASRAVVRWSKRMYSCAGVCSYDRGGLCDIALSEPLLKLRPRKDLVETLLHEMIHAYLFVTCRDQDRDGHGPNFQAHMHRINKSAGLNISIYHDFHDEVKLYQTHWWRCNGPCQNRRPHFGIVRKSMNKAPAPSDYWFESHRRNCGGTFIKIKEPENTRKKTVAPKKNNNGDITKFINDPKKNNSTKPILKDSNNMPTKSKTNGGGTLVLTKKEPVYNPKVVHKPPPLFDGTGYVIDGVKQRSNSVGIIETVRNIWANKQLPGTASAISATVRNKWADKQLPPSPNIVNVRNKQPALSTSPNINTAKKHKADNAITSPPPKMKKIDDYFKSTATNMLKDVYGQDFLFTNSDNQHKIGAVAVKTDITNTPVSKIGSSNPGEDNLNPETSVNCPVCNSKISSKDINKHLDECLNKDVIDDLCKNNEILISQYTASTISNKVKILPGSIKGKNITEKPNLSPNPINDNLNTAIIKVEKQVKDEANHFDPNDINRAKELVKKISHEKDAIKSEKYITPKEEIIENIGFGHLPSYLDDDACNSKTQVIKTEPGSSDSVEFVGQICACCGNNIIKPIEEHLEECLAFFTNNTTEPDEGASTSYANEAIVIDDDEFDESLTLNATGTKSPCPCCLQMIEQEEMNEHLDLCLN